MSAKLGRSQFVGGILLALFGLHILWRARFAFLHHTVLVPRYPPAGKAAWMDPWQAVVVAVICFVLAAVLVADAMRKRREPDGNSSAD